LHLLARCGTAAGVTLDQLPLGSLARIVAVDWPALVPEEAHRLRALGLEEGAEVRLAYRGVFMTRDPLAVEVGRMTVALRRVHARAMHVEPQPVPA
jgi:ferrous iron transport protein A